MVCCCPSQAWASPTNIGYLNEIQSGKRYNLVMGYYVVEPYG